MTACVTHAANIAADHRPGLQPGAMSAHPAAEPAASTDGRRPPCAGRARPRRPGARTLIQGRPRRRVRGVLLPGPILAENPAISPVRRTDPGAHSCF